MLLCLAPLVIGCDNTTADPLGVPFYLHPNNKRAKQLFGILNNIQSFTWRRCAMLTNNSHAVVIMNKSDDNFATCEHIASVLLFVTTTYLTVHKMKTFCLLSVLEKIIKFNYPELIDEKDCQLVCVFRIMFPM